MAQSKAEKQKSREKKTLAREETRRARQANRRGKKVDASSWDQLQGKSAGQTLRNRDVYDGQQIKRSEIEQMRSTTPAKLGGLAIGGLVALLAWLLLSVGAMALSAVQGLSEGGLDKDQPGLGVYLGEVTLWKAYAAVGAGIVIGLLVGAIMYKRVQASNVMHDTTDINQYSGDQHLALPEETQQNFDFFPDQGAHSAVEVSSMISHNMLVNKGLAKIKVARRAEKDMYDENGDLEYYKGEILQDAEGNELFDTMPIIDEKFGDDLFDASGLIKDAKLRKKYDTSKIMYNPDGSNRDKLGKFKTVADLINSDWDFPSYEVQRPAGAYLVDTAPVNTMVLAITRAGKGQTYIEPVISMWLREKKPSNMVINDPKGELMVKNYVSAVKRGFEVVQFNLINPSKTNIYNPLGLASQAAREGDMSKCGEYVDNIAEVFFPKDAGDDPVWNTSASNAFKRAVYGLIDFHLESERELREHAAATNMDPETLEQRLDEMWGQVTLYNCYQLFVQMASKKKKNPEVELEERMKRIKSGDFSADEDAIYKDLTEAELDAEFGDLIDRARVQSAPWEGAKEADALTLFFNATQILPKNTMRTMVENTHNSLRSMGGAEKMLSSVYGIAITAMSFFTDQTISTLTSGRPSQDVDLGGLSFPRRMGVRFSQDYLKRDNLIGLQAVWTAYGDSGFSEDLGKEFGHTDTLTKNGWARYYFSGKFAKDNGWLKLELKHPKTNMLVRTFYFQFTKSYMVSLDGRRFVKEQVSGEKIIKNGYLREMRPVRDDNGTVLSYEFASTVYPSKMLDLEFLESNDVRMLESEARAVTQTTVRYSEQPKAVFMVTPPHMMAYAKLILILLKQLVDLNFDKAYMTKSSQKPLYRTRFMLDELGNLQSEGKGISGFETMLSIGLGQEQQFTLILQTLQQLRKVYGDDVDKIVQGNVSNIIYLKSTDDAMIKTLETMSGTRHKVYRDSKTVTRDMASLVGSGVDGKVSYTMTAKEEPLISFNDMAFIPERNSMVFRAGDAPVWNRNEAILPMAWRLEQNKIIEPGQESYTLQTLPSTSTALEFDVLQNQPDFLKMLDLRLRQASKSVDAKAVFMEAYKYSEAQFNKLDADIRSHDLMQIVTQMINIEEGATMDMPTIDPDEHSLVYSAEDYTEDVAAIQQVANIEVKVAEHESPRYAQDMVSRSMLVTLDGAAVLNGVGNEIIKAYTASMSDMQRDERFSVNAEGDLCNANGSKVYISKVMSDYRSEALEKLKSAAKDSNSRVFSEDPEMNDENAPLFEVHAAFYHFLASLESWEDLARGEFERVMHIEMKRSKEEV